MEQMHSPNHEHPSSSSTGLKRLREEAADDVPLHTPVVFARTTDSSTPHEDASPQTSNTTLLMEQDVVRVAVAHTPSPPTPRPPGKTLRKTPLTASPSNHSPTSSSSFPASPLARATASSANISSATTPTTITATATTPTGGNPVEQRIEKWRALLTTTLLMDLEASEKERVEVVAEAIARGISAHNHHKKSESQDHFLMLLVQLKDAQNTDIRRSIVAGDLPVDQLVVLGEQDLVNPERRRKLEEDFQFRARDTNLSELKKSTQTKSTLFPCPACKKRDCSWYQRQTRSGDEPMTVICSCNLCGHQWRKY